MSQNPTPTKRERKDAARTERLERERADAAASARRKRLTMLGGLLAGAVVIVVAAILISSGGSSDKTTQGSGGDASGLQGASDAKALFAGIPQSGITLGKPDAPVTIVEFADPQCPFCAEYTVNELPKVVQDQVRTGKAKMELRWLTFIGPDSVTGASVLQAAAAQDKMWQATDLLYRNQGQENTGYMTDDFLKAVLDGAGADGAKAISGAGATTVGQGIGEAKTLASKYGVTGTPTVLVGPTGGDLKTLSGTPTADGVAQLVDEATKKAGT